MNNLNYIALTARQELIHSATVLASGYNLPLKEPCDSLRVKVSVQVPVCGVVAPGRTAKIEKNKNTAH